MARVSFTIGSPRTPDEVLAAITDFSPHRLELWPTIDPEVYKVHGVGDTWAEAVEGSAVMGGIWARERYDWSKPGVVTATIVESNFWHPGGTWEMRVQPGRDGGSVLEVTRDRRAKIFRAHVLEAMIRLVGSRMLAAQLREAPAVQGRTAGAS